MGTVWKGDILSGDIVFSGTFCTWGHFVHGDILSVTFFGLNSRRVYFHYAYGNMVIGSRVVPQPEAVQPGHVGEVPIESQYVQQRSGQLERTYWHIDAAVFENMLQNPKSTQDDPEKNIVATIQWCGSFCDIFCNF